jgi:hypothetical protein
MAWPGSAEIESTTRSAPGYARERGFINRRVKMYKAEYRDYHENAFRLWTDEMLQCLRGVKSSGSMRCALCW